MLRTNMSCKASHCKYDILGNYLMDYGYQTPFQTEQKYKDFVLTSCVEFQCYRLISDPTDFNTGQLFLIFRFEPNLWTNTNIHRQTSLGPGWFVWFVCGEGDMASIWLDIPNHTIFTLDTKSFSTKQKRRGKEMLPFFEFSDTSLIENWHCQAPGKDIGFKKDKRLHWSHREYHEQIPQCYLIG